MLGAVTVAYNVKGVGSGLNFDGPTIGKIFAGQITKWNDPAIKALNPKANLPDETIAVVHRSDGSGTTARVHRLPDEDEPGVGRQARRRRQVVRQDRRLAGRHRRQGQ